jgi:transcriptional regulator
VYVHPAARMDEDEAFAVLSAISFGLLVVPVPDAAPTAVHAPFLVERGADGRIRLEMHAAKANPIHRHVAAAGPEGARVLVSCRGPDAYVSPDWYGAPDQVPTWTYVAVHATGRARVLPESENRGHGDRLSALFEARLAPKKPWTSDKMDPAKHAAMLKGIVVMSVEVERVEGQKKLVQHKTLDARRGAVEGLRGRGDPKSLEIAARMQELLDREG